MDCIGKKVSYRRIVKPGDERWWPGEDKKIKTGVIEKLIIKTDQPYIASGFGSNQYNSYEDTIGGKNGIYELIQPTANVGVGAGAGAVTNTASKGGRRKTRKSKKSRRAKKTRRT